MSQIMTELAGKWEGFTDKQKAGISEAVAGKQQAAVFQSLMQNFDVFKKAQKELNAGDAFGSMAKENDQFVKSISGQLNKLKEIWVGVFQDLFNPRSFGLLLQGAILVSQAIAKIVDALDDMGALTPIVAMLGLAISAKMIGGFTALGATIGGVTTSLLSLGAASTATAAFIGPPTAATALFSSTLATLGASIVPILGVAAALGLAAIAFDHFNESTAEADVRLNKTISNRKNEIKTIDSQVSKLKEVQKEYDSLVGKPNKTAEEVERLAKATNKIAEIKPELVVGHDEKGNAILSMTGDVEDLIKKMTEAKAVKEQLLLGDREEKGKNAIKKNNGGGSGSGGLSADSAGNTELGKLEKSATDHVKTMEGLEKKRDATLNKLYMSTGKDRTKILEDLSKVNGKIEKEQNRFTSEYSKQINSTKKISQEIGDGLFAGVEKGANFRAAGDGVQKRFTELKKSLDFSDITTEEQGAKVEATLGKLVLQADKGKLHIGNLKKSIEEANSEFSKSGDVDKYNKTISDLVNGIEGMSKVDKENLTNLFKGIDESALQGTDGLDNFLKKYNSSAAELANNNSFAQALAAQKIALDNGFNSINEALSSDDLEVHKQVRVALQSDQDLPAELREMIRVLSNSGASDADVLKFAQKVMVDISEGDLDIESANREIENKFGKGVFEITPEILMSDGARIAGIENIKKQITDKLDDIPIEKEVKVDVASAVASGNINDIIAALDKVPKEKRSEVIAKVGKALEEIGTVEAIELAKKVVNIGADGKNAKGIIKDINKTPMQKKTTKVTENGGKGVKGNLDKINKTPMKTKTTKISQTGGSGVLSTLKSISGFKNKVITITIKKVFSTIGNAFSNVFGGTDSGNVSKPNYVTPVSTPITPMSPSPSVAPMSTGAVGTASTTSSSPASMSTGATSSTPISIGGGAISDSMKYDVNLLKELENRIQSVGNQLSILDKKMSNAIGDEKIKYLQQQNVLYKEQIEIQKQLEDKLIRQKNYYQWFLKNKGFQFAADGNLSNYEEKLILMEKEADRLDKIAEAKSKASSDYKGENEKTKNSLESASNSAKAASDKYNESLAETKKYLEEYTQVAFTDLPKVKEEYLNINNAILDSNKAMEDAKKEIQDFKNEVRDLRKEAMFTSMEKQVTQYNNELSKTDDLMKHAFGKDKEQLIQNKIDLYEKQIAQFQKMQNYSKNAMNDDKSQLQALGFTFRENGDIVNYDSQIVKLKESNGEYERADKLVGDYLDLLINKIPGYENSIIDANNNIKDSYKEQLNVVKDIQDKVTEVYKKQVEERKKLIDEELKSKTDALDKEKEAYNKLRDELDYKDDYNEQKDVIDKLQKKIDTASQDSSIGGQAKLKDLISQMDDEQKKFKELVQNNIDEQVNNMYDSESDRLSDNAEKKKEDLDEIYSDANIQKLVDKAITSGKFVDLDGNIRSLKDTMLEFENEFGDGMTAIGGLIKSELVSNLELARDTFKDIGNISNALGLSNVSSYNNIATPKSMSYASPVTNQNVTVQFNQPLVNVQGNVTEDLLPQLESMIQKAKDELARDIVKKIK